MSSLSPEDFGLDERSVEMLQNLADDQQQIALTQLHTAMQAGKVMNPSSYMVGILNGPDMMGVDEKAAQALQDLPPDVQEELLDKLRLYLSKGSIRNPSAWLVQAVQEKKHGARGMTPVMGQRVVNIDGKAQALLQTLPQHAQAEILNTLQSQTGIYNPSAWVAKACLQAGATPGGPPVMKHNEMPNNEVDEKAQDLLSTLPGEVQQEILTKLSNSQSKGEVINASAWVVRACMKLGAQGIGKGPATQAPGFGGGFAGAFSHTPSVGFVQAIGHQQFAGHGGSYQHSAAAAAMNIDAKAMDMLAKLPDQQQQDILTKLQNSQGKGEVQNPSAWVVKAVLKVNAAGGAGHFGGQSASAGLSIDQKAQDLLSSLPQEVQQEIVTKLQNSAGKGEVANPSAWVVKAALKAGAVGIGKGPANMAAGFGQYRSSPY